MHNHVVPIPFGMIGGQAWVTDSSGEIDDERPKILVCSDPRGLGKGSKTALGQQDARQRPQPTDRENARNGANVRILARPEQDPWTFHRRRQRRCGRPAQCRWTSRIENPPAFSSAGQLASSLRSVALHYHGSVPFRYRFSLYAPIGTTIAEIRLLGISAPSLRQAPPGQDISSPAAYFFGTVSALICGDGSPAACGAAS